MKRIDTATHAGDADCSKLIKAGREIVSGVHRVSGREAWAHLWRCLAWELNVLEAGKTKPDYTRFDDTQIDATKAFALELAIREGEDPADYAGAIYMQLGFNDPKAKGQIFTPAPSPILSSKAPTKSSRPKASRLAQSHIRGLTLALAAALFPWPCSGSKSARKSARFT